MKQVLRILGLIILFGLLYGVVSAQTGSLTTTFAGGSSCAGNMFDITAKSNTITIDSFDIIINGGLSTINVYYRPVTYQGFTDSSDGWTLLGSTTVNSSGINSPTPLPIGGLTIPAGQTFGLFIVSLSLRTTIDYTDGSNTYENDDVILNAGISKCFDADPFAGSTFAPRTWNGTVYYSIDDNTDVPAFAFTDNRINRFDVSAPVVVYPLAVNGEYGLVIYDAYTTENQLLVITPSEIATTDGVSSNTLIAGNDRVSVYRLADGTFQINALTNNGKRYELFFVDIFPNVPYTSMEVE